MAQIYGSAGIECGTTEDGAEVVGILFPTGILEECEVKYLTLPAAKALLIDLKDAIEACMEHQSQNDAMSDRNRPPTKWTRCANRDCRKRIRAESPNYEGVSNGRVVWVCRECGEHGLRLELREYTRNLGR